jgi:hypothetical protein
MTHGAVAQKSRASGRQPEGRRFKSGQSRPGRLAQQAERLHDKQEAARSNRAATTMRLSPTDREPGYEPGVVQVRVLSGAPAWPLSSVVERPAHTGEARRIGTFSGY